MKKILNLGTSQMYPNEFLMIFEKGSTHAKFGIFKPQTGSNP